VNFQTSLLGINITKWLMVRKCALKGSVYEFSEFLKLLHSMWHFGQPLQISHKLGSNWYHQPPVTGQEIINNLLPLFLPSNFMFIRKICSAISLTKSVLYWSPLYSIFSGKRQKWCKLIPVLPLRRCKLILVL